MHSTSRLPLVAPLSLPLVLLLGCAVHTKPPRSATPSTAGMANAPLEEAAEALTGTWHCQGAIHGPDGPSPSEVTLEVALVLDRTWLRSEFRTTSGKHAYAFVSHRTFDPASGHGVNVLVDNQGGHALSRSTDGKVWTGESHGAMGSMQIRDTDQLVSPKELRVEGRYSTDGGASFATGYDLSCRK